MLEQLEKLQYINLETFRKNGIGVKTPVWFIEIPESSKLYIRTIANSGKVKRIHNNETVNIAPCKADGAILGDWFPGQAREITEAEVNKKVDHLLDKKYGMMKKMFALFSALQGRKYTLLEVDIKK